MAALYQHGDPAFYNGLLRWWGIRPYAYPFADTEAVFMAFDCWRQGTDVLVPNACMGGGLYTYSPLLLRASLPLGAADRIWFGFALCVTFVLALSLLPPCKSGSEWAARSLAALSTATVFAVERANLDIAVFLMTVLGVWLTVRSDGWRFLGYSVFVLAAAAKFYPVGLLLLAARERPQIAIAAGVLGLITIGILIVEIADASVLVPVGSPFKDMFGARNLPLAIGLLIAPVDAAEAEGILRAPIGLPGKIVMAVMLLAATRIAFLSLRRDIVRWPQIGGAEGAFLVAGCVLIVGCFFAAQNVGYRAIFLMMMMPGLFALSRTESVDGSGRPYRALIIGVMLLLWEEFFHHLETALQPFLAQIVNPQAIEFNFWLGRELLWWWVTARLAALVAAFALTSPLLKKLRGRAIEHTSAGNGPAGQEGERGTC